MQRLAKFWEFLRNHWREVGLVVLAVGAFFLGRESKSAPPKIEYKEHVVYQDRVVEKQVVVEVEKKVKGETKVVYRDRYITPDGAVSEREVERTDTKEETDTKLEGSVETVRVQYVDRVQELKVDRPLAANHVSLLVGYDSRPATFKYMNIGGVTIGVHYERRILQTPIFLGAWAIHTGALGGSFGFEF